MLIRDSNEKERTREGGTMPRIREVGKETLVMWKVAIIPIIIGALGIIGRSLRTWTGNLQIGNYCDLGGLLVGNS